MKAMAERVEVAETAKIHVQVWSGSRSVRIVEMENAGKRGKVCRTAYFCGDRCFGWATTEAQQATDAVLWMAERFEVGIGYDEAKAQMEAELAKYPGAAHLNVVEETIRGIDAPKEELTAGVDGVWSGRVDGDGVHLCDLEDHHNEPRMITFGQTNGSAYAKASKVWAWVKQAKTMYEAGRILTQAGCRLHSYCAMD